MATSLSRLLSSVANPALHSTISEPLTRSVSSSVTRFLCSSSNQQHHENPVTEQARVPRDSLHGESKRSQEEEEDNDDEDGDDVNKETGEVGGPKGPEPTRQEKLFELLDNFVEEIGEKNVVQLISDNGSNYILASKLLQAKRPKLFWTPCAGHCLDLMLEDIGKIPRVKKAIQRGISLVGFIYNHTLALNTKRKYTSKGELVRYGVTRFATNFLTLQRLHNQKNNLRKMLTSDVWLKFKTTKERKGKKAADVVLMPTFWNDVIYCLKAMGPLVRVLRLVDNEKKPAMSYIYEAMDRAKEAIQNAFNGDESKYRDICSIIDRRWEVQLHHPLHVACHYLNPIFFYKNPLIDVDHEVVEGLQECIGRLSASDEVIDKNINESVRYKRALGLFGLREAVRHRTTLAPGKSKCLSLNFNYITIHVHSNANKLLHYN